MFKGIQWENFISKFKALVRKTVNSVGSLNFFVGVKLNYI